MPILGLRDTKSYGDAGFRPENWRRTILYSFPNGSAPLTAILSLLRSEETNDPKFHWFEKSLPTQKTLVTGNYTNAAGTISIQDVIARPGHLVQNDETGEIMLVTQVSGAGPQVLTITRAQWGAALAGLTGQHIKVVGNANEEGASTPIGISVDPVSQYNLTQIFRTSYALTGTAMKTSLWFDKTGPNKSRLQEALSYHSIEQEWAFIRGRKAEFVGAGGEVLRTTAGILDFIPAANNVDAFADVGGNISISYWNSLVERAFRVTSNRQQEKLMLCGSGALAVLNSIAQTNGQMRTMAGDEAFGMKLMEWITPHGTIYIKSHPLFTSDPAWRHSALILDVHNLVYRYITGRDTKRLTNRQNPGQDSRIDEFLTECGLEVHHGDSHMYIKNLNCYSNDLYCTYPETGIGLGQL